MPIDAVTLANQGETVLAWDPDTGRPLSNMIVWQDRRAESICTELADARRARSPSAPGWCSTPTSPPPRWRGCARNVTPTAWSPPPTPGWSTSSRGEFVTDASTASRSLLTDLDTTVGPRAARPVRAGDEPLPAIVACDAVVGATNAFGGDRAGRRAGRRPAGRAARRSAAWRPATAKCTFGTGAFLLANTGTTAVRSTAGLDRLGRVAGSRDQTSYCVDGQVYTAASAVRWMEQLG